MTLSSQSPWRDRAASVWNGITGLFVSETFLFILKRVLQALITLLLASVLAFFVIQLAPGDFLDNFRQDPQFSAETIAQLEQQFGLDQPAWQQYLNWLYQVVTQLNFGISFAYQRPVVELIWERAFNTLLLSIASIILTWSIAIPLGIIGAVNQNNTTDRTLRIISYLGQGLPTLITGLLFLLFAQMTSPLFPVGGMTSINHADLTPIGKVLDVAWHMILPTLALSITSFAGLQRIMRGQLLDVLRQDYIKTARAKGLPENRVIYVHALRNAVNPLITLLGFEFASLLGGAFITETFFNWPGLGRLTLQAVMSQDVFLVMASLMMGAVMLVAGNLLADLMLKVADPRIKFTEMG
jgi:peptide/nickel transport system permease protein